MATGNYTSAANGGNPANPQGSKAAPGSTGNRKVRAASSKEKARGEVLVEHGTIYSPGEDPAKHGPKYRTIDQLLTKGYDHSAAWVGDLQDQLAGAGLLDPADITHGLYDEQTLSAYQTLLLRAAQSGRTWQEEAAHAKGLGAKIKTGGSSRAPFSFQPQDPAAVRDALNEVMPSLIGRALDPAETEAVVQAYQARTLGAARSAYNTNISGGVAAPEVDFQAFAKGEAERLHPDAFRANEFGALASEFRKSLSNRSVDTAGF